MSDLYARLRALCTVLLDWVRLMKAPKIADDDPIRWRTNSLCHTGFTNDKWSDSVSRQFRIDTLAITDIERNESDFIEWDFKKANDG